MMVSSFIQTCIACNIGILTTYPLETLKSRKIMNTNNINLYKGVEAPLLLGGLSNGIRLHTFNSLKDDSFILALLTSGLLNGMMLVPYELYKLSKQSGKKYITFKGSNIVLIKELLGTIIQLTLYSNLETDNTIVNLLFGGLSSVFAMTFVYPLDVIYVNHMLYDYTYLFILKNIDLWIGYKYQLLRCFLGYGITLSIISNIN